jgi:hypothetical protein
LSSHSLCTLAACPPSHQRGKKHSKDRHTYRRSHMWEVNESLVQKSSLETGTLQREDFFSFGDQKDLLVFSEHSSEVEFIKCFILDFFNAHLYLYILQCYLFVCFRCKHMLMLGTNINCYIIFSYIIPFCLFL